MGRPAIVDRKLATRLRDDGWTIREVAEYFGVSTHAILMATNAKIRAQQNAASKAWIQRQRKPCEGCGEKLVWTHSKKSPRRFADGRILCHGCRMAARAVTVREDALLCSRCKEWKPDASFPHRHATVARRGRHSLCRQCQTIQRREYRWRYATKCVECGGPRGADSDYRAPMRRDKNTGLCSACYQASRKVSA